MADPTAPVTTDRPTTPLQPEQLADLRALLAPRVADQRDLANALAPASTPATPGWKTTEFWLGASAKVLGILFASGVIGTGTVAERIAGLAAALLAQLGYTVSRTLVKQAAAVLLAVVLGSAALAQTACSSSLRGTAASGAGAALDCEAANVKSLLGDLVPLAIAEVTKWISGSGTVDTTGLKADLAAIKGDAAKCALDAAVVILTSAPAPAKAGTPQAAPMAIDRAQVAAGYAQVRGDLGWAAR